MSLDNVLPMSLDNSVTYVPERFTSPCARYGRLVALMGCVPTSTISMYPARSIISLYS